MVLNTLPIEIIELKVANFFLLVSSSATYLAGLLYELKLILLNCRFMAYLNTQKYTFFFHFVGGKKHKCFYKSINFILCLT